MRRDIILLQKQLVKESLKTALSLQTNLLTIMSKLSIISEFWCFLKIRKKGWLAPIIIYFFKICREKISFDENYY
jgi:hypothetical protein